MNPLSALYVKPTKGLVNDFPRKSCKHALARSLPGKWRPLTAREI